VTPCTNSSIRHWNTNEIVSVDSHHGDIDARHCTARFYRADLQKALLAHVPSSNIHLGKTFLSTNYDTSIDQLIITFEDGGSTTADIVLGADGIRSAVRRSFVLGSEPKWTGWVAFRAVFKADRLKDVDEILQEANHWWGHDRTFFSSRLGTDLFTIVGGNYSDPEAPDAPFKDAVWNSEGDVNILREYYKDWHPHIRKMIDATPSVRQYPNTSAPAIDTWTYGKGRITLAGDAAHAHGGALAAGGSLALDDAYAFAAALWHVFPPGAAHSKANIARALSLYERTRKPHTDRVISLVRKGNSLTIARLRKQKALAETDEELRQRLKLRSDPYWIHEHDVQAAFAEVIAEDSKNLTAAVKL